MSARTTSQTQPALRDESLTDIRRRVLRGDSPIILGATVTAVTFALAVDAGVYGVNERTSLALGTWWIILCGLAVGAWPRTRLPRTAAIVGSSLFAFAVVSGLSGLWGESAEKAFLEANRVMLYLGIFMLATLAISKRTVTAWLDGLAAAIVLTDLVALANRMFPHLFSPGALPTFLPEAHTRLSFPVNYWNGLAVLVALGAPLLLRIATSNAGVARALAVSPFPLLTAVIYLASSRTGFLTLIAGVVAFVALADRRWAAAGAAAAGAVGSILALAWLARQHELVNGPLDSHAAASQGRWSVLVLIAIAAAVGAVYALGAAWAARHVRISHRAGTVVAATAVLLVAAAVVAAHPVRRFEQFKQPPPTFAAHQYIGSHLVSATGNWRWQFWTGSVDEFKHHPLVGGGAGSFQAWWAQHGRNVGFVKNAHSLYVEVLGELGIVGLLLIVAAFATAIGVGAVRARRGAPPVRSAAAAATAAAFAYAVSCSVEWMWQLTIVSVVAIALFAVCVGPATASADGDAASRASRRWLRPALAALATVALVGEADLLLTSLRIGDSQAAARAGRESAALDAAASARRYEPWASSPYLQLALVREQMGDLRTARALIHKAIERDSSDWSVWLVSARIDTERGDIASARAELHQAIALNPRSPIWSSG